MGVQKVTKESLAADKENCALIHQVSFPPLNFMASPGCDLGTTITTELFQIFPSSALETRRIKSKKFVLEISKYSAIKQFTAKLHVVREQYSLNSTPLKLLGSLNQEVKGNFQIEPIHEEFQLRKLRIHEK